MDDVLEADDQEETEALAGRFDGTALAAGRCR